MKAWVSGTLGLLLVGGMALAQEPVPEGAQFQVNSYTTNDQWAPAATVDALGIFVVVWESNGSYGTDPGYSIQGQRHAADGSPLGSQFQVNSYTTSYQWTPSVAGSAQGDFVVVWESYGSYGTDPGYSIQGQRHGADGTPLGSQFQVNSYTTEYQFTPSVAADTLGNFVVVWTSKGSFGTDPGYSIQGQRHEADGTPIGSQFQVNSYTTRFQYAPSVAAANLGEFVVVWESDGSNGSDSDYSVQAQRHSADGTAEGSQFQVNVYTTSYQRVPAVATDPRGNFVVAWVSDGSVGSDTSYTSIQARQFDPDGVPLGSQFQVNSYTTSYQERPAVAADFRGNFVVVWASDGSDGTDTDYSIQARYYDSQGVPLGGQFQVNSYTTSTQDSPSVVADTMGNFVVVWQSDGSGGTDTDGSSIHAQRYSTGVMFADGFESGDTAAWSMNVP